MKKLVIVTLTVLMLIGLLAGCGTNGGSDVDYVKGKGKLIVGITDFAPMDYK